MKRALVGFVLAVLVTAAASSLIQTLRIHAALVALGAEIPFGLRLQAMASDLWGFAPVYALIVAGGFLIAFAVAGGIRRWARGVGPGLHIAAGAAAILTALLSMEALLGMSVVAGARDGLGLGLFVAAGALGGAVFARFAKPRLPQSS
ncbi:MAG: hypothetical protein MEQ07_01455 [Aquimonas sp.]|nr:hypothetical protein [Aquimonas sp.]